MALIPPERLWVDRQQLTVLERVMAAAHPAEGCALLLGRAGASWHLQWVWPALNAWPETAERGRRFALDPREQLLAQRWGRQRGLQVIGCAHSHPSSPPEPSALDLQLTLPPALLLIAGVDCAGNAPPPGASSGSDQCWRWACWWLPDAAPGQAADAAQPVPWRMVDDPEAAVVAATPVAHASP